MKARTIFASAALMLASLGMSTAASAQHYNNGRGYDRGYQDRGHDRGRGYNNYRSDNRRFDGRHDNRRWNRHNGFRNDRRCWTEWRYHRQVRVCR